MSIKTQKVSGVPAFGQGPGTNLGGFDFDSAGRPQIVDLLGAQRIGFSSGNVLQYKDAAGNVIATFPSTAKQVYAVPLAVAGGSASSGVFASLLNPFGARFIITKAVLDITTQSTGASTMDIGVAATAISNDTLMDGVSGAAAGLFDNVGSKGTNGLPQVVWAATGYVTVAEASGNVDALVGTLMLIGYLA